jgi:hypothetical protein
VVEYPPDSNEEESERQQATIPKNQNDEALRERRKVAYKEAKRNYQAEINKAKLNSWKEFCNVAT